MSGGKGGGSTTEVTVPQYIEDAARRNLNKAESVSQLGYVPYYGADVAAFTDNQNAAFQNAADTAGAFGMSAPSSQSDVMGGMGKPTEYANGVSGYSSQPMFQQSLDQLQAKRPGQFDHINSFFIDPFTGQPGSRTPSGGGYGAPAPDQGRIGAEARQAADQRGMNASDPNQGAMDASLDASRASAAAANANGGATRSGSAGDGLRGGSTGGFLGWNGVGDMADGGGKGVKGGAYEGAGLYSGVANVATGGDGPGGDGTVICTSMHTLGLISDDVYKLDAEFGEEINHADPALLAGYRIWATPVADYILGDSFGSKLLLSIVTPLATSWAAQMAHIMRPEEYKPSRLGKVVMFFGHPVCRLAGYMSSGGGNLIKKGV
tara:strand:+ start:2098 stop:3228 length:1131 start_codon:yes stop_codon:yes gene_type:complete